MHRKKKILALIQSAKILGLDNQDTSVAQEYLDAMEFGLAFDHIVTQLYEYGIEINKDFYARVVEAATMMKLPQSEYSFLEELIRINK